MLEDLFLSRKTIKFLDIMLDDPLAEYDITSFIKYVPPQSQLLKLEKLGIINHYYSVLTLNLESDIVKKLISLDTSITKFLVRNDTVDYDTFVKRIKTNRD